MNLVMKLALLVSTAHLLLLVGLVGCLMTQDPIGGQTIALVIGGLLAVAVLILYLGISFWNDRDSIVPSGKNLMPVILNIAVVMLVSGLLLGIWKIWVGGVLFLASRLLLGECYELQEGTYFTDDVK